MGQSNETSHEWAALLPRWTLILKPGSLSALVGGILESGSRGNTDAYKNEVRRALFIARP